MNAPVRWQLQVIGKVANTLQDGEGTKELVRQLAAGAAGDEDLDVGLELEEDLVPNGEGELRVVLVCVLLETVLGSIEMASQHLGVCRPVKVACGCVGGQLAAESWESSEVGIPPVQCLERRAAKRRVMR